MDDGIIVKYIKIDGQIFDDPPPKFKYEGKIGQWTIWIESGEPIDFLAARQDCDVQIEIGVQLGTLRGVGRVSTWTSSLPELPAFTSKIEGSDPLEYIER
jgi:hypothetical protein